MDFVSYRVGEVVETMTCFSDIRLIAQCGILLSEKEISTPKSFILIAENREFFADRSIPEFGAKFEAFIAAALYLIVVQRFE